MLEGSFVAIHPKDRQKYADHIRAILKYSDKDELTWLLASYTYDQTIYPGPPHSLPGDELRQYLGKVTKETCIKYGFER